jgi:hypothetical protein
LDDLGGIIFLIFIAYNVFELLVPRVRIINNIWHNLLPMTLTLPKDLLL